ncbi:uncharacterized protein LOC141852386 isoform X2 [Brevipalpus obovatus]|uniref:uncharacterized protein LOC141852386 isoform X2 n=1 Tax=Brevipalpus obovatus TaxID=246614 RepID=UPI003D9EC548
MVISGIMSRESSQSVSARVNLYGVILVDEKVSSRSVCSKCNGNGGGDENEIKYDKFATLGSIILDSSDPLCTKIRDIIGEQMRDQVPKSFIFLSKEGWPIRKDQETSLRLNCLTNKRNLIALRRCFDKPRVGVFIENDCLGSIFTTYNASLDDLRRKVNELCLSSDLRFNPYEYKFIDRNSWPVSIAQENSFTLMDIILDQNIRIKTSSYPHPYALHQMTTETYDTRDCQKTSITPSQEPLPMIPSKPSSEDSNDNWKRSSKKRGLMKRGATFLGKNRNSEIKKKNKNGKTIMISYCRREAEKYARELKAALLEFNVSVYLDVDEIESGTDWADALNEAVQNCQVFVPLITPLYGQTQWTNREVKLADQRNKKIVPINFLSHWPPECLAIQFATTQFLLWSDDGSEHENLSISTRKALPSPSAEHRDWPKNCIHRIAKKISDEVSKHNLLQQSNSINTYDDKLIVISAHPEQSSLVAKIKSFLEQQSFHVWSSLQNKENVDAIDACYLDSPSTNLPTIEEASESFSSDSRTPNNHHTSGGRRPLSCPTDPQQEAPKKSNLRRQASTLSNSSTQYPPEKVLQFTEFNNQVKNAALVIIIASKAYFKSRTCRQHCFFCEHRKQLIVISAEECETPTWFTNLLKGEKPIVASSFCVMECLRGRIKRILDPSSKTDDGELKEAKIQCLLNYLAGKLPSLEGCIYVVGSSNVKDQRSLDLCKVIGKELSKIPNLIVVTCGFYGASDVLARAFHEEKTKFCRKENGKLLCPSDAYRSVIHVLPERDSKREVYKCKQLDDGTFEPLPYGETVFLGDSMQQRDTVIARLIDTCVIINGDTREGYDEALQFTWNEHHVVPINTLVTNGHSFLMPQVFVKPPTVDPEDWKILESDSSPETISVATVRVIKRIKDHIADGRKKKLKDDTKGNNRVRSFRRLSLKRPDRLDLDSPVSRTRFSDFSDKDLESPKKSLPWQVRERGIM